MVASTAGVRGVPTTAPQRPPVNVVQALVRAMRRDEDIATVRRHLLRAERQVARQREIVAHLQSRGAASPVAEALLTQYEAALATLRGRLTKLRGR